MRIVTQTAVRILTQIAVVRIGTQTAVRIVTQTWYAALCETARAVVVHLVNPSPPSSSHLLCNGEMTSRVSVTAEDRCGRFRFASRVAVAWWSSADGVNPSWHIGLMVFGRIPV
jgi:hypothetical protein